MLTAAERVWQAVTGRWAAAASVAILLGAAGPVGAQGTGESDGTPEEAAAGANSGAAGADGAADASTLRERLVWMLSGYHFQPDRQALDELGSADEVVGALRDLASDRSMRPSMRMRAVEMLGLYPREDVRSYLTGLLDPPSAELADKYRRVAELLRHRAMTSLARVVDASTAVERIGPYLGAEDLQIRLTAIHALGRYGGAEGQRRLKSWMSSADALDDAVEQRLKTFVQPAN